MSNVHIYNVLEKPEALPVMTGSWKCHQKILRSRISRKNILVCHYMALISIFYWITIYFTSKPGLLQLFDDVITHDNDVIWIQSLDGWIDLGLFFHMNRSVIYIHVPMTHYELLKYPRYWIFGNIQFFDDVRTDQNDVRSIWFLLAKNTWGWSLICIKNFFDCMHLMQFLICILFWCFDFSRLKKSIKAWPY